MAHFTLCLLFTCFVLFFSVVVLVLQCITHSKYISRIFGDVDIKQLLRKPTKAGKEDVWTPHCKEKKRHALSKPRKYFGRGNDLICLIWVLLLFNTSTEAGPRTFPVLMSGVGDCRLPQDTQGTRATGALNTRA